MVAKVLYGMVGTAGAVVAVQAALIGLCGAVGLVTTDDPVGFVLACVGVMFVGREVARVCDRRFDAVVDAEIAAERAAFEAEMAEKQAAHEARLAALRRQGEERQEAHRREMEAIFGDFAARAEFDDEFELGLFDLPESVAVDAREATLRTMYERGILTADELTERLAGR